MRRKLVTTKDRRGVDKRGNNLGFLMSHYQKDLISEQASVFRVQLGAYRCDQLIHQLRCLVLHLVVQVTVDIHGDVGLGMTQNLGDHDHRDAVVEPHSSGAGADNLPKWQTGALSVVAKLVCCPGCAGAWGAVTGESNPDTTQRRCSWLVYSPFWLE
jgi:hypothetical protein